MNSICAFLCVRDGVDFIQAWFENVKQADQIVVLDGGSDDGTRSELVKLQIQHPNMTIILQIESNEKYQWNEQEVRNQCLSLFKTDWILLTDVDELIDDHFWNWAKETDHKETLGYFIPHKNLWLQRDQFNMNDPWYPDLTMRFFKNNAGLVWVGDRHASVWQLTALPSQPYRMLNPSSPDMTVIPEDIHIVHYHRAEPNYFDAVMEDKIPHHSGEKKNLMQPPMLGRLRKHPTGAGLIKRRFDDNGDRMP